MPRIDRSTSRAAAFLLLALVMGACSDNSSRGGSAHGAEFQLPASGTAGCKGRWVVQHTQSSPGMITESAQSPKTAHEADRSGLA